MKKLYIPVFLLIIFCFTSCVDIEEHYDFKLDGSCNVVYGFDMGRAVSVFKNLMSDKDMSKITAIVSDAALTEKKVREGMNIQCHVRLTQNRENFVNPESLQKST